MPVPELMTWVPAQRRWTKMYRGRRYYVSARQLGTDETKEASLAAANQWWRDKQAELEYAYRASMRTPAPMEDLAAASLGVSPDLFGNIRLMLDQALLREEEARIAVPQAASKGDSDDEMPMDAPDPDDNDPELIRRREVMALLEGLLFGDSVALPPSAAARLAPARIHQVESAAKAIRGEVGGEPGRTVQAQVDSWLRKKKLSGVTPVHWNNVRHCLGHFAAFLGESADVGIVNAEQLDGFHSYCHSKIGERASDGKAGWSARYAKEVFTVARRWVRWLWEKELIALPRNLDSHGWTFGSMAKEITTWTVEEVQYVINEAPGKLKLALLLMANCGMTQKDVSDLKDSEVDWKRGTITRKRSKTRSRKDTPIVCYKLWPETFASLKKHRSGKESVLLTKTGKTYLRQAHEGGKLVSRDIIAGSFRQLCKRLDFTKQMKQLRKTSATMLESHPVYGRFTSHFLGHAPATIKERHYAKPDQALFDEAVLWLGQQLGFVDPKNNAEAPEKA
jgi:integrase